jgi:hypothetical protein
MNQRMAISVSLIVTLAVTACGGGSKAPTAAAFSDQLSTVCRTMGRGIGNLDDATSLDEVRSRATDASALFEDGLNELKKLSIPTSDQEFAGDAKDLIASFEDQLDTLDAIAKAARQSDQAAVDVKISKLSDQAADSNDLADSLDVSRCQLDPVFEAAPPTTEAVVPLTLPIATLPPNSGPPETLPLETIPFGTTPLTSNKQFESSSDLVPKGDYTFADVPVDAMTSFQSLLDLAPSMAAQSGRITGVDVFDTNGQIMGRVFAFQSDTDPLTPGSFDEATPYLTSDIPTTKKKIGTLDGLTWSDPDGTTYFLVSLANVVLWALSPSADLLEPALRAWGESIAQ